MRGLKLFIIILFLMFFSQASVFAREVKIEWEPIPGAAHYELEFFEKGKLDFRKKISESYWKGNLDPGYYRYRIRTLDKLERKGLWTDFLNLIVKPPQVKKAYPENKSQIKVYAPRSKVKLSWDSVSGSNGYQVRVRQGQKIVFEKQVFQLEVEVPDIGKGNYSWSVTPIVKADKRAPASEQEKTWVGEKKVLYFDVVQVPLISPKLFSPKGLVRPPEKGLKFSWSPVPGAEAYQLLVKRSGEKAKLFLSQSPETDLPLKEEGKYQWAVRALAGIEDGGKNAQVQSKLEKSHFKIDRAAHLTSKTGYVAASALFAPYDYYIESPSTGISGNTSSNFFTLRLSGEYFFSPQWGASLGFDNGFLLVQGENFSRKNLDLMAKYRIPLSRQKFGWFLAAKAGFELREDLHIVPSNTNTPSLSTLEATSLVGLGPSIGLDIRKQLSEKWSLGAKVSYYYPLLPLSSEIAEFSGNENSRNLSAGLQGLYWLNSKWGLAAGAYYESRAISFLPSTSSQSGNEIVSTDAAFFFGSLIYTFEIH